MKTYRLHKGRIRGVTLLDESRGIRASAPTTAGLPNCGGINVFLGNQDAGRTWDAQKAVFRIEMSRDEAERLRDALTQVLSGATGYVRDYTTDVPGAPLSDV